MRMDFHELAVYFQKLENVSSRITITEILSELFKKVTPEEAGIISYLLQGRVGPNFEPVEFGIADKTMMKAIAAASSVEVDKVLQTFKSIGDLGNAAEKVKSSKSKASSSKSNLTIGEVFEKFKIIANTTGAGSQEIKLQLLAFLISNANPLSAKYIVRIPLAKLRLGFSDMTILDSLSWILTGDKSQRKEIERAYNVRPDLGFIAETVKAKGIEGLSQITPMPGTPILMARANRVSAPSEIFEKIGECAIESKYDGLRLQVHYSKQFRIQNSERKTQGELFESEKKNYLVKMFSRNLEDVTQMFPDIEKGILKQLDVDDVIFEGEVVAYNPKTGVLVPFQETMQRKRKYDIDSKAAEIPVRLFSFELLYCNGKNYIHEPYEVRKKQLKKIVKKGATIVYAQETLVKTVEEIKPIYQEAVKAHFEGIIAKKLDGEYQAGIRGWNWIKFKKGMDTKLSDTIDAVVMGYTKGEGKRTDFGVGQFLAGVYDGKNDQFLTITKVGTGLSDEQFREFITRVKKLEIKAQPKNYVIDKLLEPDVWIKPSLVVELASDEITRSQVHTAGRVMQVSKSGNAQEVKEAGYALRFPRLVKFRDDKKATDATTLKEIAQMFKGQK
jgi:DNA ligase-1